MNLFIAILTDFSHFIKIIMAMNLFGNFEERINKYKIILIATIIALASGIIYFDEKMKIGSIVYFITTYAVFRMWYAEKRKLLLLFSIWIPFMMSMIDTMFFILVKFFLGLLPFDIKSFEELMASVLSLMFIYTVGYIYRKHYQYGLKKIEYKKDIQCIKLTKRNSNILNMIPLDCDLFITGYNSNFDVDLAFSNIINLPYDKFIETGEIDFIIDFWNSEQQVRFEFNSLKYDSNYIMSELCNIIKKYNGNRNKIMFNKGCSKINVNFL